MTNKLILGTAQFGQPYGIKGDPVPSLKEIEKIAKIAWDGGIRVIHTSWQYPFDGIEYFDEFEKIEKDKDDPGYFIFEDKLGCSIYDISEMPPDVDLKIVQLPVNVLTPNLNQIRKLKHLKFEIHARSVFLQGLLLMDRLPNWLDSGPAIFQIGNFRTQADFHGLELYQAALGYVLGLDEIDKVIVGVNSAEQLEELLEVKPLKWDYDFSITDENVLDPRRWPK